MTFKVGTDHDHGVLQDKIIGRTCVKNLDEREGGARRAPCQQTPNHVMHEHTFGATRDHWHIHNVIFLHGNIVTFSKRVPYTEESLRRGSPGFVATGVDTF